eukprot:31497-Pelagococcus_subviridis.AAC.51
MTTACHVSEFRRPGPPYTFTARSLPTGRNAAKLHVSLRGVARLFRRPLLVALPLLLRCLLSDDARFLLRRIRRLLLVAVHVRAQPALAVLELHVRALEVRGHGRKRHLAQSLRRRRARPARVREGLIPHDPPLLDRVVALSRQRRDLSSQRFDLGVSRGDRLRRRRHRLLRDDGATREIAARVRRLRVRLCARGLDRLRFPTLHGRELRPQEHVLVLRLQRGV